MKLSLNSKQLLFAVITAILPVLLFLDISAVVAVIVIIAQIGLFSALLASGFSLWQLSVPLVSYGLSYLACGNGALASLSLFYLPASLVTSVCIRKSVSRSASVVLSSLTVGLTALAYVAVTALISGVSLSFEGVSSFIDGVSRAFAENLVSNVPDSLFNETITKATYKALVFEGIKYFSMCFAVLFCNIVAFTSTAVTKRVLSASNNATVELSEFAKEWRFVLSKPSAVMFLVCYLCLIVGGETLTLPQQIAFNTVMTAIQCGVFVMAFGYLRQKVRVNGFASVFMYIVFWYIFGMSFTAMVISCVGVFATLARKTKEGDKPCKS